MFVKAIEEVKQFTRPIHTIVRYYGNDFATPWASTMFFVNENGVAVTCKHVAVNILNQNAINKKYFNEIKKDLSSINSKNKNLVKSIEAKHGLKKQETALQIKNTFMDCVDTMTDIDIISHGKLDLAIIKFNGYKNKSYTSHARFLKKSGMVKQGKSLCRYGYPFAEFNNFSYNPATDDIDFTNVGNMGTPSFPLDGIITRTLLNDERKIFGIEMSTPGLKGQSGGPLFDENGIIYGMQFETAFLHLGFDLIEKEMLLDGKKTKVNNQPFLYVGRCIHVDRIKEFLTEQKIKFYESD